MRTIRIDDSGQSLADCAAVVAFTAFVFVLFVLFHLVELRTGVVGARVDILSSY
jgi:hypothetical protein